jgi:hypothetical protein
MIGVLGLKWSLASASRSAAREPPLPPPLHPGPDARDRHMEANQPTALAFERYAGERKSFQCA